MNVKLKRIFKSIARREKIDIKFIYFMSEGKKLSSDIYDKTIREIIKQKNQISILVYDLDIIVEFYYNNSNLPDIVQCKHDERIIEACQEFSDKNKKDIKTLNFFYLNNKLDLNKRCDEIIYDSEDLIQDEKINYIKIYVKDRVFCDKKRK